MLLIASYFYTDLIVICAADSQLLYRTDLIVICAAESQLRLLGRWPAILQQSTHRTQALIFACSLTPMLVLLSFCIVNGEGYIDPQIFEATACGKHFLHGFVRLYKHEGTHGPVGTVRYRR